MTELKLYCTIATQSVVEILMPRFEADHGTKIAVVWGTAPQLVKRLQRDESGDVLLLTKRIGTGVLLTAQKESRVGCEAGYEAAVRSMLQLNRRASQLAREHGAHAMTDITGYALLGHASEVAIRLTEWDSQASRSTPGAHIVVETAERYDGYADHDVVFSYRLCVSDADQAALQRMIVGRCKPGAVVWFPGGAGDGYGEQVGAEMWRVV